jgi:hypothetical protein
MPAMTARLAHVWRKPWKPITGLILARPMASAGGRACSDLRQSRPLFKKINSSPVRPAHMSSKNSEPSSVKVM